MNEVFRRHYTADSEYDKNEIFRYMKAKPENEEINILVEECIKECGGIINSDVLYSISDIDFDDDIIHFDSFSVRSSDLRKNLCGCEKAVIFAATAGLKIDRLISKYSLVSPAKALVFQAIGAERVENLCDRFELDMKTEFESDGFCLKPRFSPGYGNLSLETQRDIFSLLQCEKSIGLTLGENLLMSPSKSVTAIIGIYRK